MSERPGRRPWRPWRSKIIWATAIAFAALRVFGASPSDDRAAALRDRIKGFNRQWFNPWMLLLAGHRSWPVARLEHRGRRSGRMRATPLLAWPVHGGFMIPMPYGADVDWAMNLEGSGEGILQHQGLRYRVGNPRIASALETLHALPPPIGRAITTVGMRYVMMVEVLPSLTVDVSLPA